MNPDRILSHLRELSTQAMPRENQPASHDCDSLACGSTYRLELMATCFRQLDEALSRGGMHPAAWATPLIPTQRSER